MKKLILFLVVVIVAVSSVSYGITVTVPTTAIQDQAILEVAGDRGVTQVFLLKKGLRSYIKHLTRINFKGRTKTIIDEWGSMSDADKNAIKAIIDNHVLNKVPKL